MARGVVSGKKAYHEISHLPPDAWLPHLRAGVSEDGWHWDWTTLGTLAAARARRPLTAQVVAKSPGVWAAESLLVALPRFAIELGGELRVRSRLRDGASCQAGTVVAELKGTARTLLALERPFLNLAQYVGGIATRTRSLVDRTRAACPSRPPRISATRKTLPGYRDLALHGILCGGGHPHRLNLGGGVLIKENHIAAAGGIARAIAGARAAAPHGLRIEIEVRDAAELGRALAEGADAVLLDNFSPAEVRQALARIERASGPRPIVEVSGGLSETTIADYAQKGVDVLSVGSLTHSVTAVDLSLLVGLR